MYLWMRSKKILKTVQDNPGIIFVDIIKLFPRSDDEVTKQCIKDMLASGKISCEVINNGPITLFYGPKSHIIEYATSHATR